MRAQLDKTKSSFHSLFVCARRNAMRAPDLRDAIRLYTRYVGQTPARPIGSRPRSWMKLDVSARRVVDVT